MDAYQVAIERTSTPIAPWHVVPADRKWYARLAVQQLLIDALEDIDPRCPRRLRRRGREGAARELVSQASASTIGRNFTRVSSSSDSGTLSATMPAPA